MAGQRNIHRMRDLRGEAVMCQGGDQADYRARYDATSHLFKLAAVPKVVQRPRVNAQTNRVAGAEHSFVAPKRGMKPSRIRTLT